MPSQTAPEHDRPGMRITGAPCPTTFTANDGLEIVSEACEGVAAENRFKAAMAVAIETTARLLIMQVVIIHRMSVAKLEEVTKRSGYPIEGERSDSKRAPRGYQEALRSISF